MRPCEEPEVIIIDSDEEDDFPQMLNHPNMGGHPSSTMPTLVHSTKTERDKGGDMFREARVEFPGTSTRKSNRKGSSQGQRLEKKVARKNSAYQIRDHDATSSKLDRTASFTENSTSSPTRTASPVQNNETRHVNLAEAQINHFLEHVHGIKDQQKIYDVVTEIRDQSDKQEELDRYGGNESDSSDDVKIIEIRRTSSSNNSHSIVHELEVVDEVEVVDGPSLKANKKIAGCDGNVSKPRNCKKSMASSQNHPQPTRHSRWQKCHQKGHQPGRRFVFYDGSKPTNQENLTKKTTWAETNFNANMSREDAMREQEKLFQESAARVRTQARIHIAENTNTFSKPIIDVHSRYPGHWKFTDPYARLGLPKNSPIHMVKTHYRILARCYHPDKSGSDHTSKKFQAIAEAYTNITNSK